MKATVFGATGFIGARLVQYLRAKGYEVFAPERGSRSWCNQPLGHVFYCIGITADFRRRPLDTVQAHVSVVSDILHHGIFDSFLYLSSTRVYCRASGAHETAVTPVVSADPSDLYNLSKLTGEAACLALGRDHVRVARLSNVYGSDFSSENFLSSIIQDAFRTGRILLRTAPDSEKDYIWIEDVAYALEQIALKGSEQIYNVASGENTRHGAITQVLSSVTGCDVVVQEGAPIQRFPTIDTTRLSRLVSCEFRPLLAHLELLAEEFRSQLGGNIEAALTASKRPAPTR
ncbi:SDR family oxidoreductase [Microvirga sp. SM9]|nr:SDR family oxidoreductase [Microvirga lenta]